MEPSNFVDVTGKDGHLGTIDVASQPLDGSQSHVLIRLDNDQQIWVPFDLLVAQPGGGYFLPVTRQQLVFQKEVQGSDRFSSVLVLPVIQEELVVGKRVSTDKVRVTKRVHSEERELDEPGFTEEVEIERIPRNQVLEEPTTAYYDGSTLVIPIVEEIVVVEKRLMLKEEVRITKQRREVRDPKRVTLRREEAIVERVSETQKS